MEEEKVPEDLGIKVGTQIEAFWTDLKNRAKASIFKNEQGIIADKHLIKLCDKIIKQEQAKK